MLSFEQFSLTAREDITRNLQEFFEEKQAENLPDYFYQLGMYSSLANVVSKGKLVRGTLFLFSCEMFGVSRKKELIDIASAIELLHTGLLIHDDIIDNDDLRRGIPTIHALFKNKGEELGIHDATHYGVTMGVLAGDAAFHSAIELLSRYQGENMGRLLRYYASEVNRVILAEGADSELGQTAIEPTTEEIKGIYQYKTARYTFSMPFTMAGIVAGVESATIETMDKIGELAGFIFQLKDDELGLVGSEEKIGKPVGSDIRENKKTLIRKLLYERVDESELSQLNSVFGKPSISRNEIQIVKDLLEKYQIQKEVDGQVELIMNEIQGLFNGLSVDNEYKKILQEMLLFNLKRRY